MVEQSKAPISILRRRQVERRVGLTSSPIYARIKAGTFPSPVRLGSSRAVGWLEHEIDAWLADQIQKSRSV
jgi:prophage regulatory protein